MPTCKCKTCGNWHDLPDEMCRKMAVLQRETRRNLPEMRRLGIPDPIAHSMAKYKKALERLAKE